MENSKLYQSKHGNDPVVIKKAMEIQDERTKRILSTTSCKLQEEQASLQPSGLSIHRLENELNNRNTQETKDNEPSEVTILVADLINAIENSTLPEEKPSDSLFVALKEWSTKLNNRMTR
jgi:hypothetical protein